MAFRTRTATIPMTLSYRQGQSPVAGLFISSAIFVHCAAVYKISTVAACRAVPLQ